MTASLQARALSELRHTRLRLEAQRGHYYEMNARRTAEQLSDVILELRELHGNIQKLEPVEGTDLDARVVEVLSSTLKLAHERAEVFRKALAVPDAAQQSAVVYEILVIGDVLGVTVTPPMDRT